MKVPNHSDDCRLGSETTRSRSLEGQAPPVARASRMSPGVGATVGDPAPLPFEPVGAKPDPHQDHKTGDESRDESAGSADRVRDSATYGHDEARKRNHPLPQRTRPRPKAVTFGQPQLPHTAKINRRRMRQRARMTPEEIQLAVVRLCGTFDDHQARRRFGPKHIRTSYGEW